MAEDEKKDVVEETPAQDETAEAAGPVAEEDAGAGTAEGQDSPPAGPVAGEDSSSSQAAGEEPTPAPPAEAEAGEPEAPAEKASAPAADEKAAEPEAAAEEPAAEEKAAEPEAAEPNPEDELPWKERRRLERSRRPHEAGPQLSVEERAARRAEVRKREAGARRKQRADAKAKKQSGTGTPPAERDANAAKMRQGIVVSDKGQKTITVRIDIVRRHPVYEKVVRRSRTLHAHDERNEAGEGDVVRVVETRPLSKTKRWRLVEVVEKAR
jgi:small subunit ribosomal protein S17